MVERVPAHGEDNPCIVIGITLVVYIAGMFQQAEGRIYIRGKILVGKAESPYVESKSASASAPHTNLIKIGQMLIDISDIISGKFSAIRL